ncbi:hypothetical protein [Vibrio gallaecicus]|uniref:hypothetical protein n=1 Tax=Vibrio gallaecicus TaxID=552386 RepID=UPI0025B3B1E8|nr:hypothetical protein [Vibrio gallaecicus]MDN3616873.1 hypothetical protein [Vibrio gallaecicus]
MLLSTEYPHRPFVDIDIHIYSRIACYLKRSNSALIYIGNLVHELKVNTRSRH